MNCSFYIFRVFIDHAYFIFKILHYPPIDIVVLIILEFFIHKLDLCYKAFMQKHSSIGAYNIGF
jgi:hypothetical protein